MRPRRQGAQPQGDGIERTTQDRPGKLLAHFIRWRCSRAVRMGMATVKLVVTLLLQHGLDAYRKGKLNLNPHPLTVKMTLQGNRS